MACWMSVALASTARGSPLGARLRLARALRAGMVLRDLLEHRRGRPRGLRFEVAGLLDQRDRSLDVVGAFDEAGAIEQQQRSPCRMVSVVGSVRQRFEPRRRVRGSPREDLERQPCARLLGGRGALDAARIEDRGLRVGHVARNVRLVRRAHQQRADFLVGRGGRPRERADDLAEVLQTASFFEQANQPLERFAKQRVGVEGRQVVARGGWFVARSLVKVRYLSE